MKKHALILTAMLSLTLCACSDGSSDSTPAATSAPETVVSSKEESSSQAESKASDESSKTDEGQIDEQEAERLAELEMDYNTTDEFLNSGFIDEYYKDIDFGNDKIVPEADDGVIVGNVNAHYSCYYIYYEYKEKTYGICVNTRYNKLDKDTMQYSDFKSAEELYEYRLSNKKGSTEYEYDKENDLVKIHVGSTDNEYIEKITPSGKLYDVFSIPEKSASVDDIIEFSKHLTF